MGVIAHTFGGDVVWSSVSQFEVLEGILLFGIVLIFVLEWDTLRVNLPFHVRFLKNHLSPPISDVCLVLGVLGAVCYGLLAVCNFRRVDRVVDVKGIDLVKYPLSVLGYFGGSAWGPGGTIGYGALALLTWVFTIALLSLGVGAKRAVKIFAIPSILFLTGLVFLFDPTQMDSQALNAVSGVRYEGTSLLSNWFLLTVSLCLTLSIVLSSLIGKKTRTQAL